ncbi:MAG: hypothetical protein AC479_02960 [miscellaneous Crenarchaeota group-6 archaeon AD8-1]|nr:MAG: hypothetical protein AC479_02960 [miscellaneous Crenarchaeota group-6 archaeon AD8-1]
MAEDRIDSFIKTGLLIVALTWFLFTFYQFTKSAFNIYKGTFWIELTDTAGVIGLGFRTVAGFIAVITILFFIFRKDLSKPEIMMSIRWIVLCEAVCFLSLFLVVIWGLDILVNYGLSDFGLTFFIGSTLPVLFESLAIPFALVMLFLALNPNKPPSSAVKWSLIVGTFYIFMVWFNNATGWIVAVLGKGIDYVLLYPANIFSFVLTTIGLLLLGIYAAYFTKKSVNTGQLEKIDLRKVGMIVTFLSLYFLIIYIMWLLLGSIGGWSDWYAWFLGHNVELWMMALPLVGVPLLFKKRSK